jgi:hypothetical protein
VALGSVPAIADALARHKSDDELLVMVHGSLYK